MNYFFFISKRVNGTGRMYFYPLPGLRVVANQNIISSCRMRFGRDSRKLAVQCPPGTIFALKIDGCLTYTYITGENNVREYFYTTNVDKIIPIASSCNFYTMSMNTTLPSACDSSDFFRSCNSVLEDMQTAFNRYLHLWHPAEESLPIVIDYSKVLNRYAPLTPATINNPNYGREMNVVDWLATGICTFKYRKADGTIRTAIGSSNWDILKWHPNPESVLQEQPTSDQDEVNHNIVHYFDFSRGAWRAFNLDRLQELLNFVRNPNMEELQAQFASVSGV